jgi:hypothetical protein
MNLASITEKLILFFLLFCIFLTCKSDYELKKYNNMTYIISVFVITEVALLLKFTVQVWLLASAVHTLQLQLFAEALDSSQHLTGFIPKL